MKSYFYNKFFSGYSETAEVLKNGKKKIQRVYTGNYYFAETNRFGKIFRTILYFSVFILGAIGFIYAAIKQPTGLHGWVVVPMILALLLILFLPISLICYAFAPKKMTIYEYRESSVNLKELSLFAGIFTLISLIALIVLTIFEEELAISKSVYSIAGYFLCTACMFVLYTVERNVKYCIERSSELMFDDGVLINEEGAKLVQDHSF